MNPLMSKLLIQNLGIDPDAIMTQLQDAKYAIEGKVNEIQLGIQQGRNDTAKLLSRIDSLEAELINKHMNLGHLSFQCHCGSIHTLINPEEVLGSEIVYTKEEENGDNSFNTIS